MSCGARVGSGTRRTGEGTPGPGAGWRSYLVQEVHHRLLVAGGESVESVAGRDALTVVQLDRIADRLRASVVQEAALPPYAPQRGRPHHARAGRARGDPVS